MSSRTLFGPCRGALRCWSPWEPEWEVWGHGVAWRQEEKLVLGRSGKGDKGGCTGKLVTHVLVLVTATGLRKVRKLRSLRRKPKREGAQLACTVLGMGY